LLGIVYEMMERACSRMRMKGVAARTLWLHLRHSDGFDITRRLKFRDPSPTDPLLFREIEPFFLKSAFRRQRIGYLSLTFTDIFVPTAQLALFQTRVAHPKPEALVSALDAIRSRYGERAVEWGRTWGLPGGAGSGTPALPGKTGPEKDRSALPGPADGASHSAAR
jgi:hypothetical protein